MKTELLVIVADGRSPLDKHLELVEIGNASLLGGVPVLAEPNVNLEPVYRGLQAPNPLGGGAHETPLWPSGKEGAPGTSNTASARISSIA